MPTHRCVCSDPLPQVALDSFRAKRQGVMDAVPAHRQVKTQAQGKGNEPVARRGDV